MKLFQPSLIYVDDSVAQTPLTRRVLNLFPDTPIHHVADASELKKKRPMTQAKRILFLTRFKGQSLKSCQGQGDYVCCDYHTLTFISNCHLECSYCFLQDYLKDNPVITLFANVEEIIESTRTYLLQNPQRHFRIGTGELADSLALDAITGLSQSLVPLAASLPNMTLELKTKSNQIQNLLEMDSKGHTVISWSLNPQNFIDQEEYKTASLTDRLGCARQVLDHGYKVAFHLDPLLALTGWQQEYRDLIQELQNRFEPSEISWISLGSLRYNPGLKETAIRRFPRSRLFQGELFPTGDGKVRYLRDIRQELYAHVKELVEAAFPGTKHYLCMETKTVWKNVYGQVPGTPGELEKNIFHV